ncbi:N(G),N(G)-dimethylarginine dimethylaminohydrolase [Terrabacter aeriphilus]|uniref:N(G),N(G)-dimethylarginine dimethylaminohydrolase n=1 Tax=Terrabacter aeriphilus TaxID=515662 RepID=A0ABP9JGM0_9MICO
MHRRLALVRRPSPRLAEGIVTHLERSPDVDADLARRQWQEYVDVLRRRGWQVLEAAAVDDCPDGVFVEDDVVVHGDVAVLCRSGAVSRRPEVVGLRGVLEPLGYRVVEMTEPATLDGGDVLKHGHHVWVGVGGRTNAAGVEALRRALAGHRVEVVPVPVSRVLHLKSAVTALPDGTVVGYPPLVDDTSVWSAFLPVPEEPGSHVVLLGGQSVLLSAAAPRTAQLLSARGLDVTTVDISEFEKLEGCVTCLSVRLRG